VQTYVHQYVTEQRSFATASFPAEQFLHGHERGGKLLRTVPLPCYNYHCLSFSADGKTLAVAGEELAVRIFSYPDFTPHLPTKGHTKPVTAVAYSPDGKRAHSSGEDGSLIIWDLKTSQPLRTTWPVARGAITDAFPTPDGRFLAVPVWTSSDNLAFELTCS
jgi:WD40 repeat protein